jgi:hypothetical protein
MSQRASSEGIENGMRRTVDLVAVGLVFLFVFAVTLRLV